MSKFDQIAGGAYGFERITSGDTGDWSVIKAVNADVTFGVGCEVAAGDPPADGDVLQQGDWLPGLFTKIVYTTGQVYGFPRNLA